MYRMLKLHSNFSQGALSCQYTFCKYGAFRAEEGKKKKKRTILGTWLASGRQRGHRRTCTLPGNCSETRHCGWGMGSGEAKEKGDALWQSSNLCLYHHKWYFTVSCQGLSEPDGTHREKGVDDVSLDRAEWLVLDQNKDLLLFLQADEVAEPGPLSQSANKQVINMWQISYSHTY